MIIYINRSSSTRGGGSLSGATWLIIGKYSIVFVLDVIVGVLIDHLDLNVDTASSYLLVAVSWRFILGYDEILWKV